MFAKSSLITSLALLAGAARALHFTSDIPLNAVYEVGTNFVLTWEPEDRTDTFNLTIGSFLAEPIIVSPNGGPLGSPLYDYQSKDIVLDEYSTYPKGQFIWPVALIDGREGDKWYYRFEATYPYGAALPRAFKLKTPSS